MSKDVREQLIPELRNTYVAKEQWECLYKVNRTRLTELNQGMVYDVMIDYINTHLEPIYLKASNQIQSSDKLNFEISHLLMHVDAMDKSDEQISNMESSLLHIIQKLDSVEHKSETLMEKYIMAYNGLCFLYEKQGRYHEGLEAAQYIIYILSKRYGLDGQVSKYGNMNTLAGTFAMFIGELDIAEDNIQKALVFFTRLIESTEKKEEYTQHHPSLINLYVQLAQIKLKQNKPKEFLALLNTAKKYHTLFPLYKIEPIKLKGKYLQNSHKFNDAINVYENALDLLKLDTTSFITIADLYNSLGESYFMLHDTTLAITHFNTAISFAQKNTADNIFASEANSETIRSYRNLAKVNIQKSDLKKAYSYGQKLIQELQLLRSNQFFQLDKIELLEDTYDDYGILLKILFEQGKASEAYTIMQQGKAQLIKEGKIKSLYQKQSNRGDQQKINETQSQLLSDAIAANRVDSLTNVLYKQREKLKSKQSKDIKKSLYAALQTDLRPLSELQSQLLDQELILEYYIGTESAFCLELSNKSIQLHSLAHPDSIKQIATEFSEQLIQKSDLDKARSRLSKLLLPTTIDTSYNTFIIIPDGMLHYIPYELLTFNKRNLIDHASVSYLLYNDMYQASNSQNINADDILLLAPSFVSGEFENLKFSSSEVLDIQNMTKGKVSIGTEANKEFFVEQGPLHKILHLSTHAKINESASEQSFIAFHDAASNHKLFLHQIEQLALQAELVVLSACETGIGKLLSGEAMFSMKKAFFQAGSKSVVSSLWPSNDQTTAEIMSYFYENLKAGKRKDEALRQAKLKYLSLADPGYDHPYYWAGFIAVGDMSALSFGGGINLNYLLIVGFILIIILGTFLYTNRIWN